MVLLCREPLEWLLSDTVTLLITCVSRDLPEVTMNSSPAGYNRTPDQRLITHSCLSRLSLAQIGVIKPYLGPVIEALHDDKRQR